MCQQYDIITIYLPGRQFATGVVNTDGKFDTSIVDTSVTLLPVSILSTTPAVLVAKCSAIVVDTSGAP
jgi:hypothetical protein